MKITKEQIIKNNLFIKYIKNNRGISYCFYADHDTGIFMGYEMLKKDFSKLKDFKKIYENKR